MKSKSLAPIPATLAFTAFCAAAAPAFAADAVAAKAPAAPAPTETAAPAAAKETKAAETTDKDTKLAETTVSAKKEKEAPSYKAESANFKRPTPLKDTPQQITVVSQQQLRDRNVADLRQAIQASPGITSNVGEGGFNGGDNFNIRGFSSRSDIFVDGIRDTSLYSRDMFATEQVEISRGANSMYQGRGSVGGSIGTVTKSAHQGNSGDLAATLSTAESVRVVADANYDISANTDSKTLKDAGVAARVSVLGQTGGSARNADIDDTRIGVAPSIAAGLGKQTKISLTHVYYDQQSDGDYGIPLQNRTSGHVSSPVDHSNWYGIKGFTHDNATSNMTTFTAETELDTGHRLRNITRYNTNQRDTVLMRPQAANFTTGVMTPSFTGRYTDDATLTNQTDYLGQFKTGEIGHTLNVGVELQQEKITNRARTLTGTIPAMNVWNPNNNPAHNLGLNFSGAGNKATAETYSLYINETLHATKWLDVVGGLRVDRFEFNNKTYPASPSTATTSVTSSDTMLSWRGGLVLKPTDTVSVYGTVSNTFSPSAQDLGASAANANTDPEETYLYEVGAKWEAIKGKLMLGAAYFYTDRSNIRQTDAATGQQVLTGAAYSQGIELSASGNVTERWNISGGFAFIDTEVTKSTTPGVQGKELINVPDFSASIFTTYNIGMGWTIGGGARYTGERQLNNTNTIQYGEYVVFDALLRKQLTDYASVQVNVDNIFDERYIENARNGQTQWATPGAGRVVSVTARLTF